MSSTSTCPFCAEPIALGVPRCPHCGERPGGPAPDPGRAVPTGPGVVALGVGLLALLLAFVRLGETSGWQRLAWHSAGPLALSGLLALAAALVLLTRRGQARCLVRAGALVTLGCVAWGVGALAHAHLTHVPGGRANLPVGFGKIVMLLAWSPLLAGWALVGWLGGTFRRRGPAARGAGPGG